MIPPAAAPDGHAMFGGIPTRTNNRILAALTEKEFSLLKFHPVQLRRHEILIRPGEQTRFLFFLTSGLASTTILMRSGSSVEIGLVGTEGYAGFTASLGDTPSQMQTVVQIPGNALRIHALSLRDAFCREEHLGALLRDYVAKQLAQISQLSACNRLHNAEQRLARWLLTTGDRLDSNTFSITHELLGRLLGTKRETITTVARHFQTQGMINYTHGKLQIRQRRRLEQVACECYQVIRDIFYQ